LGQHLDDHDLDQSILVEVGLVGKLTCRLSFSRSLCPSACHCVDLLEVAEDPRCAHGGRYAHQAVQCGSNDHHVSSRNILFRERAFLVIEVWMMFGLSCPLCFVEESLSGECPFLQK
jgi:hypothetical protein